MLLVHLLRMYLFLQDINLAFQIPLQHSALAQLIPVSCHAALQVRQGLLQLLVSGLQAFRLPARVLHIAGENLMALFHFLQLPARTLCLHEEQVGIANLKAVL